MNSIASEKNHSAFGKAKGGGGAVLRACLAALMLAFLAGCGNGNGSGSEPSAQPEAPAAYLARPVQDDVFYFVMPDRFANGDPGNDLGAAAGISHGGFNPRHKAWFHGGDLQGLAGKLDYLEGLGVTAIWMTPILRNRAVQGDSAAYHGYWIVDFTEVDPHFGSDAGLRELIDAAHARGIKVFFDIITNHTANVIHYRQCHQADGSFQDGLTGCAYISRAETEAGNGYTPFLPPGMADVKRPAWLNEFQWYNNQGDFLPEGESVIRGDFSGLDDLDTSQREVVDGFIAIYSDLISRFRPDGFRIDTVRHVELEFWQAFAPAILAHARAIGIPNFTVFGEAYIQNAQQLSVFTRHGRLPSVLDFAFQEELRKVLADGMSPQLLADLLAADDFYASGSNDARDLMTFTGNHDMGRIGYFLNEGTVSASASKEERLARAALAHSFIFFARGVPVIYYGDEQGFTGDGVDQDARENMFPSQVDIYNDNVLLGTAATTAEDNFNPRHPLYLHFAELADAYGANPAVRRGLQAVREHTTDGATLVLSRLHGDPPRDTLALFNFGTAAANVQLPAWSADYELRYGLGTSHAVTGDTLSVRLAPLSAALLAGTAALPEAPLPEATASAAIEEHGEGRFLVVDFTLEEGALARQEAPLRIASRWAGAPTADNASTDTSPPWRAVFPLAPGAAPTSVTLNVTLDNFAAARTTQELTVPVN